LSTGSGMNHWTTGVSISNREACQIHSMSPDAPRFKPTQAYDARNEAVKGRTQSVGPRCSPAARPMYFRIVACNYDYIQTYDMPLRLACLYSIPLSKRSRVECVVHLSRLAQKARL
jgi:hypothetical protein